MTSKNDREILRQLAAKYADIVNSDNMNKRRETWRLSNKLTERTVPFVIEDDGTFIKDLVPACQCKEGLAQIMESYFMNSIAHFEMIDDDMVFPPYYPVNWIIDRPSMLPELKVNRSLDSNGREFGYETNKPLADLENNLHKLVRGEFKVDRDATYHRVEVAEDAFGDILPVETVYWGTKSAGSGMAYKAVEWIGMENFYMAMIDQPENVHRFFNFVSTEGYEFLQWLEDENLIRPNRGEFTCGSGSYGYTGKYGIDDEKSYLPKDCWGFLEAQESVGISNEMYAEFIFPYQKKIGERYGLMYYGCCEPVHALWPTIKQFHNLRKISISPWCDQKIMADALGKDYVFSRKPHPLQLCSESFNAKAFESHVQETLDITKDNFVELIFRDTCALNGSMKERVIEACKIVKKLIDRGC